MRKSLHDELRRQDIKKSVRRIDVELVKRMVVILHDEGKQRRTKMASRARLAYNKCRLYVDWLELMGLARIEKDEDGIEFVNITEKGNELYTKYSEFSN